MAGIAPLSPDEAYYWVWSRAPALSYLDHPPMVAWFIAAGTAIAGETSLGIRLLGPLAAALGSIALVWSADTLFPQRRPGVAAAVLLNASLLLGVGSVTMTPDTPLLLFWTLGVAALARVATRRTGWVGFGVAAGLALLSKYTAVLLAPAVLVWLLAARDRRAWFARWQPWAAAAIALLLFAPVVMWNARHGWASFAKQGGRVDDWRPLRAAQFLGELAAGQIGLATPLVAVLCAAGIAVAVRRAREPRWGLLAALTVVPALVFVEHALGDRVQANWPAILYPAAAIGAAALGGRWRRLVMPAAALGFALAAIVWLQAVAAPFPLTRRLDPTLMRLGGWPGLAAVVAARARADGATFIASDNYGTAAVLARLLPPIVPVLGVEARWAYFNLPDGTATAAAGSGLLVRSARREGGPNPADWREITPAGEVTRGRDGVAAETYRLYHVTGAGTSPTPLVVLPRPR